MIYTVTFNPSLDYIVSVNGFELGKTNRTDSELLLHGGSLKNWIFGICPKGAGVNRKCVRRDGICTRADWKESNDTRGIGQDCRKTIW